jgi:hypothetical protein
MEHWRCWDYALFFLTSAAVLSSLVLLTACSSFDRTQAMGTRFEPMGIIEGETRFHYVTFTDAVYPVDSPRAKRIRVEWLE